MAINLDFSTTSSYSITDLTDIFDFFLFDHTITSTSSTAFSGSGAFDGSAAAYTATGTGFQFRTVNSEEFLSAGVLETIDLTLGSETILFSNLNMDVAVLTVAIESELAGDTSAIEDFLLAQDWKISLGDGNDVATKSTRIGDNVLFNPRGDDRIFGNGGDDNLFGGDGNDVLKGGADDDILDGGKGNDKIFGGIGQDLIKGGVGSDKLFGSGGKDKVKGGGGNDVIDTGAGRDVAFGGGGADKFVFKDNYGTNRIKDFNELNNREDINLRKVTEITDFADLTGNHMTQSGSNVVIDDLNGTRIIVENALLADMGNGNFIF